VVTVPVGSTVYLYTDGVVERPRVPLEGGSSACARPPSLVPPIMDAPRSSPNSSVTTNPLMIVRCSPSTYQGARTRTAELSPRSPIATPESASGRDAPLLIPPSAGGGFRPAHAGQIRRVANVAVTMRRDHEIAITVVGDCYQQEAADLQRTVESALQDGARTITLDLSGLSSLAEEGIGALLAARRQAQEAGATITLRDPSDEARRKLEITGLTDLFALG
jgi:anti-anti-sigma factor